jgi:hypothetical protein
MAAGELEGDSQRIQDWMAVARVADDTVAGMGLLDACGDQKGS